MAFNWQTFKTRALTAVVFVVVMMAGLLWNRWSFFLLFSVVHFGAWAEYSRLVGTFNKDYGAITKFHRYGSRIAGWCLLLYFTDAELRLGPVRLQEAALLLGLVLIIAIPLS